MKTNLFIIMLFLLYSCNSQKPIATTHTERIEVRVMPVAVGADTIEITEYRLQSTDTPCSLLPTPYSIKSTRGVNISRYKTDTTSTLRITLRPDTVFVPYTNHIRSDTIVVPDRVCQQKLNHSNMTNLFLILILIAIFIIFLKNRMTRK
jgi:hypothetical protein